MFRTLTYLSLFKNRKLEFGSLKLVLSIGRKNVKKTKSLKTIRFHELCVDLKY